MAKSVNEATKILKETADWLLVAWKKDKRIAAAGATPFLEMCGNIFGGWMMMKSALKASEYIKKGDESIFYSDKIATASFYIDNIMIPSLGLKNTVRNAHKNLDIIRNIQ